MQNANNPNNNPVARPPMPSGPQVRPVRPVPPMPRPPMAGATNNNNSPGNPFAVASAVNNNPARPPSIPSASPFANPPGQSPRSMPVRPSAPPTAGMSMPVPSRPMMPSTGPSGPSVPGSAVRPPMPRPPVAAFNATRPPMPGANPIIRPPMSNRPPMVPQSNAPPRPELRPPPPSSPMTSSPVRPQIPVGPQVVRPPLMRPPIPSPNQNPIAPPRPSIPPSPQLQASQFARPPSSAQPSLPNSQNNFARPPVPPVPTMSSSTQNVSQIPQIRPPTVNLPSSPNLPLKPPMPPIPSGYNQQQPPQSQMPLPHQQQQPLQPPQIKSPAMRYPPAPGYSQQPPMQTQPQQQFGYPQNSMAGQPQLQQQPLHSQQMPQQFQPGFGNPVAPAPQAPKVNPAAIPSVVAVLEADDARFRESGQPFYTFSSVVDNPPPLPTTRSVSIIDDGNSSPHFIRSTLNHIPISEEICENTKIPLGLLIQPFANAVQAEVPLVESGISGPIRCNRCRAYINPHVQFIKGGRYFVCNLCEMSNEVPDEYYANLDMSGKRIDLDLRPELRQGTVDFVASKEYFNRPAGKPHLLFILDSSRAAVASGAFQAALESVKAFASSPQAVQFYGGMAILTHDRILTFYTLREGRNEPQVLVVGDVFDPFVPLHANDLYFDPTKCAAGLSVLFNHLNSTMNLESRPVESCFGAAVSVALESLKVRGGRAVFFQTTLPSYGPGALNNRESGGAVGAAAAPPADKANPLLFPQGDYYTKLAVKAAEEGISLSLVSTPAAHIDLATIGVLANTSSGSVLHYPRFVAQQHTGKVVGDVLSLLSTSFAFDCLVRIRCFSGLQVRRHYGHFYASANGHDLSFGAISSDQSLGAFLEYDGKLSEKERASFQIAILHTDAFSGQRRIRVLNLALPCTSSIQTIFRMSELDAILAFYLKKNVFQILEAPSPAFPASFIAKCVNILAAYRRYCAANMSSGQLILPDSLKLFPIMTLAIIKDPAFNTAPMPIDSRWHAIHRLSDLSLSLTITHFYPQLFPLASMLEHEEILPACLRLSREHLSRDGMYLLNDGYQAILYVGDSVDPATLIEIFGISQLNTLNLNSSVTGASLPVIQNPRSAKLRQIITVLRSQNAPRHLNLRLIRQSVDVPEDAEFSNRLVEDANSLSSSYVDFLCRVHAQIQQNISQGSTLSLADRTSILSFLQ